jgi:hypothetical protein
LGHETQKARGGATARLWCSWRSDFAAVAGGIYLLEAGRGVDQTAEIGQAQQFVKEKFRAESAHFEPPAETSFTRLEDGEVRVNGTVDILGANGSNFTCSFGVIMHRNPDLAWVAGDVNLVPM